MIAYINGEYRCYSTANGITRHYLSCRHNDPRAAIRHRSNLDPFTSPLRVSDGTSTPAPSAPLPGLGQSDVPSELRLGHTDPPRP